MKTDKKKTRNYAFFQNRQCENYPCHNGVPEDEFNCLFCYCPLYPLGDRCGGHFVYLENGVKSCENCSFPHLKSHYDAILSRFPEIADIARKEKGE